MKKDVFYLKNQEYIQLDQLMKLLGWAESGASAHEIIDSGLVKVDDAIELRRRRKLFSGSKIEFADFIISIR